MPIHDHMSGCVTREQLVGRPILLSAEYVQAREINDVALKGRLMTDMSETRAQLLLISGPVDEQSGD